MCSRKKREREKGKKKVREREKEKEARKGSEKGKKKVIIKSTSIELYSSSLNNANAIKIGLFGDTRQTFRKELTAGVLDVSSKSCSAGEEAPEDSSVSATGPRRRRERLASPSALVAQILQVCARQPAS